MIFPFILCLVVLITHIVSRSEGQPEKQPNHILRFANERLRHDIESANVSLLLFGVVHKAGHFALGDLFGYIEHNTKWCAPEYSGLWGRVPRLHGGGQEAEHRQQYACVAALRAFDYREVMVKETLNRLHTVHIEYGDDWLEHSPLRALLIDVWDGYRSNVLPALATLRSTSVLPRRFVNILMVREPHTALRSAHAYHIERCSEDPFAQELLLVRARFLRRLWLQHEDDRVLDAVEKMRQWLSEQQAKGERHPRERLCERLRTSASKEMQYHWVARTLLNDANRTRRQREGGETIFVRYEDFAERPREWARAIAELFARGNTDIQERFALMVSDFAERNAQLAAEKAEGKHTNYGGHHTNVSAGRLALNVEPGVLDRIVKVYGLDVTFSRYYE